MGTKVKVARRADVPPGTGRVVVAAGREIALFNVGGSFYALDNVCPHQGGPLGEGMLTGDIVTCPWHGATFDVRTGAVTGPPAQQGVATFPVTVEGDEVFVEVG
jgi:nitrite reductase/ring-hydroxylating ferredoxin subunit